MCIKMLTLTKAIILLVITVNFATCARILAILPSTCYSHQVFFRPLWKELAIKGHEVILVTADPIENPSKNLRQIDISEGYKMWFKGVSEMVSKNDNKVTMINSLVRVITNVMEVQVQNEEFQNVIRNKSDHFDLIFVESFFPIFFTLKKTFNCPVIAMTSLDSPDFVHRAVGNPVHPLLYPTMIVPFGENKTFLQRFESLIIHNAMNYYFEIGNLKKMDQMVKDYIDPNYYVDTGIYNLIDMLFINTNPIFSAVRPHSPACISISGLHQRPMDALPKDLAKFLNESKEGVVYFSLGSSVKSVDLAEGLRKIFLDAFAQLPYKILWKFEAEDLPGKPKNVKISKWLPQQDLLMHPNIKLFITQGGIQSLEEALYSKVPLVVIPFFVDQEGNARKAVDKGLGIKLNHRSLTVDILKNAIMEVIENPEYKERMVDIVTKIQDQPMTPLQKAVWWTEYVIRHKGARHLKGPRIPTYQYYYFDLLAAVLSALCIFLVCLVILVKYLFSFVKCWFNKKAKNE